MNVSVHIIEEEVDILMIKILRIEKKLSDKTKLSLPDSDSDKLLFHSFK